MWSNVLQVRQRRSRRQPNRIGRRLLSLLRACGRRFQRGPHGTIGEVRQVVFPEIIEER